MKTDNSSDFSNMDIDKLKEHLTPRQLQFCIELKKDGIATAAAIRAGYSEKGAAAQASRLLKMPQVSQFVSRLFEQDVKAAALDKNGVVKRAYDIYLKCMQLIPAQEYDSESARWVYKGNYTFNASGAIKALSVIKDILNLCEQQKLVLEHNLGQKLDVNIQVVDSDLDCNQQKVSNKGHDMDIST